MQVFLMISILFLFLYTIYDVLSFSGQQLISILVVKIFFMIPSLVVLLEFSRTKYYWDINIRQKVIVIMTFVTGVSITVYSYLTQGGSYGVFGLFIGISVVFAPLHFRPCFTLTF